jgi:hypothetical protein
MTRLLHLFLALAATVSVAVSVDFKLQQWTTSTTCSGTPDKVIVSGKCEEVNTDGNANFSSIYEGIAECKKGAKVTLKMWTTSKTCAGTGTPMEVPMNNEMDTCFKESDGSGSSLMVCGGAVATSISVGTLLLSALVAVISM